MSLSGFCVCTSSFRILGQIAADENPLGRPQPPRAVYLCDHRPLQAIWPHDQNHQQSNEGDVSPDEQKAAEAARTRTHAAFGQIVLALLTTHRYRHLPISELQGLVLDPLLRDKIALATANNPDGTTVPAIAAIGFWASVSDEVDARIQEQVTAGVFPIRLKQEDWASGTRVWLFDIVAQSQQAASSVLVNFKTIAKTDEIRLHPIVTRQVDPELMKQMNIARVEPAAKDQTG
jgi:cytolysin-activating lysine-acyltransferase